MQKTFAEEKVEAALWEIERNHAWNPEDGASTIWTYQIDESKSQFSALPRLAKTLDNQMKGTLRVFWKALRS